MNLPAGNLQMIVFNFTHGTYFYKEGWKQQNHQAGVTTSCLASTICFNVEAPDTHQPVQENTFLKFVMAMNKRFYLYDRSPNFFASPSRT